MHILLRRLFTAMYNRVSDDEQPEEHNMVALDNSDGHPDGMIDGKYYEHPHCNADVLHARFTCKYCDAYPERQKLRALAGIPFTPAEANGWEGNVAQPHTEHVNVNPVTGEVGDTIHHCCQHCAPNAHVPHTAGCP